MKYNPMSARWEVWWMDTNGQPFLAGWAGAELPEDALQYWYARLLKQLLG